MARNLSLAVERHVPFSFPKLFGSQATATLSIYRGQITLRDILVSVRDTFALIAAAGRVGAAVEAGRAPDAKDLATAGLEAKSFKRPQYRI